MKFHKHFQKQLKKLPIKVQNAFFQRLDVFVEDPYHPLLNHHQLKGKWEPLHSINITGDYRAIFQYNKKDQIIFRDIGTHSKLYG